MKFRLQKVLDLRSAQEKMAQQELAVRQQEYQMVLSLIERLSEDERAAFDLIKQQGLEIELRRFQHLYNYIEELKKEFSKQEIKRQKILRLVEQQREVVKKSWQKRRVLEILKSKAAAAFMEVVEKEGQKQLDEQVLFSFEKNVRKNSY